MCCRAEYGFQCAQLIGYKGGHVPQRLPLQYHHQVIAPGDQIDTLDLRIAIDTLRNAVEALTSLGRHPHLDQRSHLFIGRLLPVHKSMVSADNALRLQRRQLIGGLRLFDAQQNRKLSQVDSAVLLDHLQQFLSHTAHFYDLPLLVYVKHHPYPAAGLPGLLQLLGLPGGIQPPTPLKADPGSPRNHKSRPAWAGPCTGFRPR